ncbi:hypothetical protein QVD17_25600 [Tagetes erecta]|uniref:MAR-binding filament-like protein 1-1 n=1 Tax=Tagetes erecta TaxID=13708 RepID=A0AAD8NVG9_TARER|nr:hypothetical protein QVD17_25600 [Tagetes erecta]
MMMMMGFKLGTSSPLHFPSISSSSQPLFFNSHHGNTHGCSKRKKIEACVQIQYHDPKDNVLCKRRSIIFMGISFLPFLNLKARAFENLDPDESENSEGTQALYQIAEVPTNGDASSNPFVSLSSGLGIVASCVLGAFYASAQKEKSVNIATIESMKAQLAEKEAAVVSMQKSYDSKLQQLKEEKNEEIKKSNQEKQSLMSQLSSANNTVHGLGQEFRKEKKVVQELENQIDRLMVDLKEASNDKEELKMQLKDKLFSIDILHERINLLNSEIKYKEDNLANVGSALAVKESEFKKLSSMYEETVAELTRSKSKIETLKQEIFKLEKESELNSSNLDDLNARVRSLCDEKDVTFRELESYKNEYNELKTYSVKQADSYAKLLEESEKKLEELKEKLELTLTEMVKKEEQVNELTHEKDGLRQTLDIEAGKVKSLENKLRVVQKSLDDTRNEAAELTGFLEHYQDTCRNLEEELSAVQIEYSKSEASLQKNIDGLKQTVETLTNELESTKNAYMKSTEDLNRVLVEIQEISDASDSLSKELEETYKNLENTIHELKEEKKNTGSLTQQVNSLKTEISEHKESRNSMETDLEETTKALNEMNQNTNILTRELEISKTKISQLEDEKEALYNSLDEHKRVIQETRENMEDAHSMIMKIGKERERFEKKGSKLEKELAAAKGEILRLRNVNDTRYAETAEEVNSSSGSEDEETSGLKKVRRRKKVVSQQKET